MSRKPILNQLSQCSTASVGSTGSSTSASSSVQMDQASGGGGSGGGGAPTDTPPPVQLISLSRPPSSTSAHQTNNNTTTHYHHPAHPHHRYTFSYDNVCPISMEEDDQEEETNDGSRNSHRLTSPPPPLFTSSPFAPLTHHLNHLHHSASNNSSSSMQPSDIITNEPNNLSSPPPTNIKTNPTPASDPELDARIRRKKAFRKFCRVALKIGIVLISFAGFLYQAQDICHHYFSYRTVVYTNTEQDSLVDLPSITFCLPTYFTKETIEELYEPYIKRNVDETAAFKNRSMLDAIKPVIYETFQKQAFKDLTAAEILERSISDDGIIECRLFYPPQHWPNLTRERMYEIVQYGLPCEEVTQVIPSINANGKCFTFFSQLLTDGEQLRAYQQQQSAEPAVEYQQYPQMTSFATSSASSASTRSSGPVAPPIVQHSHRYVPVLPKVSVNHGYRFHSGRFMRLQVQFNRDQYTVISDGHQRECIQVHPPFKIPSEACLHSINPGMSYDFVLTKTKAILQPPPYQTNCQSYQAVTQAESELLASMSDASELKEFYLKPMSRSDCIDKCMIHIYEKHCGCLPIHISIWQRSSMFLNMSVCDYEDFERISPCLEKELSSTCYDTCKSDCIDRHYHLHAESRVYPSDDQIRQSTGVERARLLRLRQSAATISIWSNYLSDITYVHTPAMSLIQLICYLGGLAGLWLGVSVMTVSGWLAQLYPLAQQWNVKQRFIWYSVTRNAKYLLDSAKNIADRKRTNNGYRQASSSKVCLGTDGEVRTSISPEPLGHTRNRRHAYLVGPGTSAVFRDSVAELVKQSSITSSSTTTDSGLSMESKNYLDEAAGATTEDDCAGGVEEESVGGNSGILSEQDQARIAANLADLNATLDKQRKLSIAGNSGNALMVKTDNKKRRHSMAHTLFGGGGSGTAETKFNGSKADATSHPTPEKLVNHHRWAVARRSVYWSNYSSMSTSSDDLSLISNTTTSTTSGGGGNSGSVASGFAAATTTAFRRMSLVNSKFNYKV